MSANEITRYIELLARKNSLTEDQASRTFQIMMMGGATPAQMAAVLMGLRIKGETVDELTGAALALRQKSGKINAPRNVLDTCGTGGDQAGTLNISTAVAFVVAACGVLVAKHGNRAISSKSGSADVLHELGVNIEADVSLVERSLKEAGICFMMAPKFHTAMRHVAPVRQELSVRTIFNLLGPLCNPASPKYQLLGVYSKEKVELMARVLRNLGVERAWVVNGYGGLDNGLDELTTTGASFVAEVNHGSIRLFEVTPEEAGLPLALPIDLMGGTAQHNAMELKNLLRGEKNAYRHIVLLNAAAALVVAGVAADLKAGVTLAAHAIDSGRARATLDKLVEVTNAE